MMRLNHKINLKDEIGKFIDSSRPKSQSKKEVTYESVDKFLKRK